MDSIASTGTVFTHAYAANPLCVPCRTSIFTGLYPHQTGVQTNADITRPGGRMVRSSTYKYRVFDFGEKNEILIDCEKDPGEMVNLAGKRDEPVLERHRRYLAEWSIKINDSFTAAPGVK